MFYKYDLPGILQLCELQVKKTRININNEMILLWEDVLLIFSVFFNLFDLFSTQCETWVCLDPHKAELGDENRLTVLFKQSLHNGMLFVHFFSGPTKCNWVIFHSTPSSVHRVIFPPSRTSSLQLSPISGCVLPFPASRWQL